MINEINTTAILFAIVISYILYIIYESYFKNVEGFENITPKEVLFGNTEVSPIHIWNNNIKNIDIVGKEKSDKPLILYVPDFSENKKKDYDNKYFGFTGTSSINTEISTKRTLSEYNNIKAPLAHIKNTALKRRPTIDSEYKNTSNEIVEKEELDNLEKTPATWDYINNKPIEYKNINKYDMIASFGINHSLIDIIQKEHMIKIKQLLDKSRDIDIDITKNNDISNDFINIINIIKQFGNSNLVKLSTLDNYDFGIRNISVNEIENLGYIKKITALINYYNEHISNKHTKVINDKITNDNFKNTRNTIELKSKIDINDVKSSSSLKTINYFFNKIHKNMIKKINRNYNSEIGLLNIKLDNKNFSDEIKNDFKFNYIKMFSEYNQGNGDNDYELKPLLINPLGNKKQSELVRDKSGNVQYDQLKSISVPFGVQVKLLSSTDDVIKKSTNFEIPYYHKDNLIYNLYFKKIFTDSVLRELLNFHDNLVSDYKNFKNPEIYKYIYYTKSLITLKGEIDNFQNKLTDNNRQRVTARLSVLYDLSVDYLVGIFQELIGAEFEHKTNHLVNDMPEPDRERCNVEEGFDIGPMAKRNDNAYQNSYGRIDELNTLIQENYSKIASIVDNPNESYYKIVNETYCRTRHPISRICYRRSNRDVNKSYNYKDLLNLYNIEKSNGIVNESKYSPLFLHDKSMINTLNDEISDYKNEINELKETRFYEEKEGFTNHNNNYNNTEGFNNPKKLANDFYKKITSSGELEKYLSYRDKVVEVAKNDKDMIEEEATAILASENDILLMNHKGEELKYLGQKIDYTLERLNVNRLHMYYDKKENRKEMCDENVNDKSGYVPNSYDKIEYVVMPETQQYIIDKSKFKYKLEKKLIKSKKDILISYLGENVKNINTVMDEKIDRLKKLKNKLKSSGMTYKYIEIYKPKENEMPNNHINIGQLIQLHEEQQGKNRPNFVGYNNKLLREKYTTIPKYCWVKVRDWKREDIIWEKEFNAGDNSSVEYIAFYKNPYTNTIMVSTIKNNPPPNSSVGKIVPCPDKGMQIDRLVEHNKRAIAKCSNYSTIKDKHKLVSNKGDDVLDDGLEKRIYTGAKQIEELKKRAKELKDENIKANVINSEFNKSRMQTYLRQQKKEIDLAMQKLQAGRNKVDVNVSYPISIIDNIIDIIANSDSMTFEDKKIKIKQLNEVKKSVIYGNGDDYKKNVAKIMKDCPVFDMTGLYKKPVPCYGCNI